MLLDLPPELIQLIFQHSDTPSFLEAAFSCRTLYEVASSCRGVLLHHLRQTPGLSLDTQSLQSKQLFWRLVKRASQQLYGAQFRAQCTTFDFGARVLDARASSLASDGQILALVARGQGDVHLFNAASGQLRQIAPLESSWGQPGVIEILKTAFDEDDGVYVLQRFTPLAEVDSDAEHPFVRQALQSSTGRGKIYLARHSLRSPHDPVRACTFPDQAEYEPLALAAAHRDTFAISWQHVRDSNEHEVVLYTALTESGSDDASRVIDLHYNSCVLVDGARQRVDNDRYLHARLARNHFPLSRGPVIHLAFNDRSSQLLYYYRAQTLYGSFQRINMSSFPVQPTLYENSCLVQFSDSLSLLFSIAIPFFGTHSTHSENGRSMCQWKYLAFGIATHRTEDWTVACLLKSESVCQSRNCGHVLNLGRGRRFPDWTVVARLWGFQGSTNSLGCIVSVSKRGTRVAVANWKILYVWVLEPNVLIEQNASGFYPPSHQSESSEMVELRPIVLNLDAVCFKLQFTDNEDELLAITDRGLMYWNLGSSGRGQQRTMQQLTS